MYAVKKESPASGFLQVRIEAHIAQLCPHRWLTPIPTPPQHVRLPASPAQQAFFSKHPEVLQKFSVLKSGGKVRPGPPART